jgi:hypothetical protein
VADTLSVVVLIRSLIVDAPLLKAEIGIMMVSDLQENSRNGVSRALIRFSTKRIQSIEGYSLLA